ncbi:hypothetical protein KEJ32_03350 [Candidatus Bathyarchaeota archaeon]|nr:hypothetical protein [Candidatus Bathyarchaeota archaeon]
MASHLVLDYNLPYEKVVGNVRFLQRIFGIGDTVVVETTLGFHVYAVVPKFEYDALCEIVERSACDPWFKDQECVLTCVK